MERPHVFAIMCKIATSESPFPLAAFIGQDKELVKQAADKQVEYLSEHNGPRNVYEVREILIIEVVE